MKRYLLLLIGFFILTTNSFSQKRIVSLASSLTKNIYLLGASDQLVGCTSFCEIPAGNKKVDVVASAVTVNLEKVLSLKPDLVLASSLTNPETLKKLNQLGIQTALFPYPKSFDEVCSYFVKTGELIGLSEKAKEIVAQSRAELEKIRVPQNSPKPSFFIEIGAKPLFGATGKTFLDDYITFAGGTNILKDQKLGNVTRESILLNNPDYIILARMGGFTGEEERKTWLNYKELRATKGGHVYQINSDDMCSPTPPEFIEVLKEIIALKNTEKSKK